jgi:hypothetical protein
VTTRQDFDQLGREQKAAQDVDGANGDEHSSHQRKLPDYACAGKGVRSPGDKHQGQTTRDEYGKQGALLVKLREFSRAKVAVSLWFENESKVQHCDEKTGDAAE